MHHGLNPVDSTNSTKGLLFLPRRDLGGLIEALQRAGYRCVGPSVRDGAIVYGTVRSAQQLVSGYEDRQEPGSYRLGETGTARNFSWANGPQALKPLLFPPEETLWRSERRADGTIAFEDVAAEPEAIAVIGVRACDLAALALQEAHFRDKDRGYRARREKMLLVAVNCTHPASTCFCVSTGDGPEARDGADLVLSELDEGFVVRAATDKGASIVAPMSLGSAKQGQLERARKETEAGAARQQRRLPGRNLRDALYSNLDHPRWADVAERCLSCGNCVSVCPTCFCHAEVDKPSLDGASAEHVRKWDACYTAGHSYIHGVLIRADTRTRYRQWLTHKLGCVGCGRCIAWCPVGIDITEEATAICGEDDAQ
jgi:sulfhydrogenase subunit beta (sulfur reductase)